jgi:hypothetical protein
MAQNKSNWIWWTLGGVSVIGLGVGAYIYFKNKPKNGGEQSTPPPAEATPSIQNIVNTVTTALSPTPFKNQSEGDAFRAWVNDNYPNYAKEIDLDRSWREFDNSTIRKAWSKYGTAYQNRASTTASTSQSSTPSVQGNFNVIDKQMKDAGFPFSSSGYTQERRQFIIVDRTGPNNILANFTRDGGFWIELPSLISDGQKFGGTWSSAISVPMVNPTFTIKLSDNSYNASDANVSTLVKQVAKLKFPNETSSLNFTDSGTKSNLEGMMHGGTKNYVDTHDSML